MLRNSCVQLLYSRANWRVFFSMLLTPGTPCELWNAPSSDRRAHYKSLLLLLLLPNGAIFSDLDQPLYPPHRVTAHILTTRTIARPLCDNWTSCVKSDIGCTPVCCAPCNTDEKYFYHTSQCDMRYTPRQICLSVKLVRCSTGVFQKNIPANTLWNTFTSVMFFCVKFCKFVGSL